MRCERAICLFLLQIIYAQNIFFSECGVNFFLLTSLKIKHLYGNSKDESKNYSKSNHCSCNHSDKIMLEIEVIFQKLLYC